MKYTATQPALRPASWTGGRATVVVLGFGLAAWVMLSRPLIGVLVHGLPQLAMVAAASALLFLLPGLALLRVLWAGPRLGVAERLCLAGGVSLALPPLLLEAAHVVGLPWGAWTTYLYLACSLLLVIIPRRGHAWHDQLPHLQRPATPSVLLGAAIAIAFLVHYGMIHDLPVGLWGDAYHHTMIAQLLVDHGGLFTSWEPFAPLSTFTYHYGFHANVAFFHWLTGIPVPHSLLLIGAFLPTLAMPLAYVLARRWSGSPAAGLWAAILTGFVSVQPTYYINWSRFTQLSGQIVLPVVLICIAVPLEAPRLQWRALVLAGLMTAALCLTHYIVAVWAALFVMGYLVVLMVRTPEPRRWIAPLRGATLSGTLAVFFAAPWLWNTLHGYLSRNVAAFVNNGVAASRIAATASFEAIVPSYLSGPILLLSILGFLLAAARRTWRMTLFGLWALLLLLTVAPNLVGLPGTGVIPFFTAAIALYLLAIPLAAYLLGAVQEMGQRLWAGGTVVGSTVVMLGLMQWGTLTQAHMINPYYELLTPADAQAMAWIRANTATGALFLVNMFPAYGDTLLAGDDGGLWIPLLTGRRSTLPPLTYGSERSSVPAFSQTTNRFARSLHQTPLPSPAGVELCRQAGIRYVYSGPHQEHVDYRVDVAALRKSPLFTTVYERDGVVIFALKAVP